MTLPSYRVHSWAKCLCSCGASCNMTADISIVAFEQHALLNLCVEGIIWQGPCRAVKYLNTSEMYHTTFWFTAFVYLLNKLKFNSVWIELVCVSQTLLFEHMDHPWLYLSQAGATGHDRTCWSEDFGVSSPKATDLTPVSPMKILLQVKHPSGLPKREQGNPDKTEKLVIPVKYHSMTGSHSASSDSVWKE